MTGAPCLDGDECPPVAADEVPTPVRWALPELWEAAVFGDLLREATDEPPERQAGIQSGGTTVVKRYVFGGRVAAMRRGGKLFFMSADHLGSASVILDEQGRWLADQRFFPYGEAKRLDGASESYPTDRLFTGMGFRDTLGLYRMGARWYDPYIEAGNSLITAYPVDREVEMLYVTESCPICLTGEIGFRLCSDHHNVVLMCDECDSVWLDPQELNSAHVVYPQPPEFAVAPHCSIGSPRSRWATREEVAEAGWSGYIAGEGGSLDDVCQDSKG